MRRRFDYAEILQGWRAIAADNGLDPLTGTRIGWWAKPDIWTDAGVHHSSTEAAAIRSIAAQARAAVGAAPAMTLEQAMTREFRAIVREALAEDMALKPLRDRMAAQGKTVETVNGVRLEAPLRVA